MIVARNGLLGCRRLNRDSVFDIAFVDWEIKENYCQLQLRFSLRSGFSSLTVDWGDGTVQSHTGYLAAHNYTSVGRFTVRVGCEAKNWRLWECYAVDASRRTYVARPQVFPKCWSDFLESAEGTYCGWNDSNHGGVQGRVIPWGRSVKTVWCCWQMCRNISGGFPAWTPNVTDATGAFDGCTGLSGAIPKWGRNITKVTQCYCDCPGVTGRFPNWPEGCVGFGSCYKNATGLCGAVPEWPACASDLESCFSGATGAVGIIPAWPEAVTDTSRCYYGCTGLTGAWTDDPALLMPDEKVLYPGSTWYRCGETVSGCSDAVRALFTERWGGTRENT